MKSRRHNYRRNQGILDSIMHHFRPSNSKRGERQRQSSSFSQGGFESLETRRVLTQLSGLIDTDMVFNDPNDLVEIVGDLQIAQGVTVEIGPNVNAKINSEVHVTVDGTLRFDNATQLFVQDTSGSRDTGIIVNGTGALRVINTDVLGSARTEIIVNSGGTFEARDSLFTVSELRLNPGSIITESAAALVTGNEFELPIYAPIEHLQNSLHLSQNQKFRDVNIFGGELIPGQTVQLDPLGSADASEMRYVFDGNFAVQQNATMIFGTDVDAKINSEVHVTVDGTLRFDNATQLFVQDTSGSRDTGIIVNGTGALRVINTDVLGSARTEIIVNSGGTFEARDSLFTVSELRLNPGSIITESAAALVTGNEFELPIYAPIEHLQNSLHLSQNQKFRDVNIFGGELIPGQTVQLDPLGSADASEMRYVFDGNFAVQQNATMIFGTDVDAKINSEVHVTVDGTLRFDNATQLFVQDTSGSRDTGIIVNGTGALRVINTDVLGSARTEIIVNSGGTFEARDSLFTVSELYLGEGSTGVLIQNDFDTPLTINSASGTEIRANDFEDLGENAVVAVGNPNDPIDMGDNWWGTTDDAAIEVKILDQNDEPSRPLIDFDEPLEEHPLVPDYLPLSLTPSGDPVTAGSTINVEYNIRNDSPGGDVAIQSAVLFYLNVGDSQDGAHLLSILPVEPLVASTETGVQVASLTMPGESDPIWRQGLPADYTLSMLVDATNQIPEADELNNSISTTITTVPDGDFNNDGRFDIVDIDSLIMDVGAGNNSRAFDLTGDGLTDLADRDRWLELAAIENGLGSPYLLGDANLDGVVDVSDFGVWNSNKFTMANAWSSADFNGDNFVDTLDFNLWNANKFTSSDRAELPSSRRAIVAHSSNSSDGYRSRSSLVEQVFAHEENEAWRS